MSVSFITDPASLDALLPPGFSLTGEALVTVEIQYYTRLEWLAGRGYNTIAVRFPACYQGQRDHVVGSFLSVLWENLADPILSGRDELGFSKLYCEIPEARVFRGRKIYGASWLGHTFMELEISGLIEVEEPSPDAAETRNDGTLHYKYVPRTGQWGEADLAYACLTPSTGTDLKVERSQRGSGRVEFLRSTWEQLPTQFHIVNALAALPVKEERGAVVVETLGGKDLSDQRALL